METIVFLQSALELGLLRVLTVRSFRLGTHLEISGVARSRPRSALVWPLRPSGDEAVRQSVGAQYRLFVYKVNEVIMGDLGHS